MHLEEPVADDGEGSAGLPGRLQEASGLKLAKLIIREVKDVAKFIAKSSTLDNNDSCKSVVDGVQEFTLKCLSGSSSKTEKLLNKFEESDTFSCTGDFFKTFLKVGMKSPEEEGAVNAVKILRLILSIAGKEGKIGNPILGIQMMLSHSRAEDIFLENINAKAKKQQAIKDQKNSLEELEKLDEKKPIIVKRAVVEMKYVGVKTELLKLWLVLVQSFTKISKLTGTDDDKKILENSVPYLMQMYTATLNGSDKQIFEILKLYTSKKLRIGMEALPLFGPKCFEAPPVKSNPLYAHSIRANAVLGTINDVKAFETAMKWIEVDCEEVTDEELYDLRFLLPLLCHCLDEKNICDVVKVISNGWIYFIMRGLGLSDLVMRNISFLCFKRLIFNLHLAKGFRLQDVKVWLHYLLAVKKGLQQLPECKLSTVVATWNVATCEVLRQPSHPMYTRVTHFLLAKPVIDLTIVPDLIPFFNPVDGSVDSREWMLNILAQGLRTREDWVLACKVPVIRCLCSAFALEKIAVQRKILKVLANGASIPEVAKDMVDKFSILLWIANINTAEDKYYRRELEDVYRNLSLSCSDDGEYRNVLFKFVADKHKWTYHRILTADTTEDMDCDDTNINEA